MMRKEKKRCRVCEPCVEMWCLLGMSKGLNLPNVVGWIGVFNPSCLFVKLRCI